MDPDPYLWIREAQKHTDLALDTVPQHCLNLTDPGVNVLHLGSGGGPEDGRPAEASWSISGTS